MSYQGPAKQWSFESGKARYKSYKNEYGVPIASEFTVKQNDNLSFKNLVEEMNKSLYCFHIGWILMDTHQCVHLLKRMYYYATELMVWLGRLR